MPDNKTKSLTAIEKLKLGLPLMPVIFIILAFISILSPLSWQIPGLLLAALVGSAVFSIVSAYCITSFLIEID